MRFALTNVICLVGMSADVSRLNRHFLVPLILPLLTQYPEDIIELYLSQSAQQGGGRGGSLNRAPGHHPARHLKVPQFLDSAG